jgi:hypothetical protein
MSTSGAYRLLALFIEQDIFSENVLFRLSKQAVNPKSGHEPMGCATRFISAGAWLEIILHCAPACRRLRYV